METIDKIKKAQIKIQEDSPFFAYLSLYLKFKEKNDLPHKSMAVDSKGNVYYDKSFVDGLNQNDLSGVILHELLHKCLLHLTRGKGKNPQLYNISADLCVNCIVLANGYSLCEGGLIPNYNDEYDFNGYIVKDVSKKTADEIYDELKAYIKKNKDKFKQKGEGEGGEGGFEISDVDLDDEDKGFDEHIKNNKENAKDIKEAEESEKVWSERLHEASAISKLRGKEPKGMGRHIEELHKSKIDWRGLLRKHIKNSIPYDYTMTIPNRRSLSVGEYMPSVLKEKIEIVVAVDLSGSVGQKEYTDFMSEVVGIARAFQNRISIRVLSHDVECYDNGLVANGNVEKLKSMELKGGGGTSFIPTKDFINKKYPNTKMVVWLTDGYGDKLDKKEMPYEVIWCLSEGGSDELLKDIGRVIKLD